MSMNMPMIVRKSLLDRVRCTLGRHVHDAWFAVPGKCAEVASCSFCGVLAVRPSHTWRPWAPTDTPCEHVKTCVLCDEVLRRPLHAWVSDGPHTHRCAWCGEKAAHEATEIRRPHRCDVCSGEFNADGGLPTG